MASKHEPGGRSIKQLAQAVNLEEKEIKKFFKILIKEPSIVKITSGRYFYFQSFRFLRFTENQ